MKTITETERDELVAEQTAAIEEIAELINNGKLSKMATSVLCRANKDLRKIRANLFLKNPTGVSVLKN
jgi:vacuolar-type H+-ATPase subunit H